MQTREQEIAALRKSLAALEKALDKGPRHAAYQAGEHLAGERGFVELDIAELTAAAERWVQIIEGPRP